MRRFLKAAAVLFATQLSIVVSAFASSPDLATTQAEFVEYTCQIQMDFGARPFTRTNQQVMNDRSADEVQDDLGFALRAYNAFKQPTNQAAARKQVISPIHCHQLRVVRDGANQPGRELLVAGARKRRRKCIDQGFRRSA